MQHVIQEADAGPDPNLLGTHQLRGMVIHHLVGDGRVGCNDRGGEVYVIREGIEGPAVEGQGDLDLGLVGVAVYEGRAAGK